MACHEPGPGRSWCRLRRDQTAPAAAQPNSQYQLTPRVAYFTHAMYRRILVALENGPADQSLVPHVAELAAKLGSSLVLLHVADGWAARNFDQLALAESEEMRLDREYLEKTASGLRTSGLDVEIRLGLGNPPNEILRVAEQERCDLISMATHGHRLLGDLIHGSTIAEVRHRATVPVLLVRAATHR